MILNPKVSLITICCVSLYMDINELICGYICIVVYIYVCVYYVYVLIYVDIIKFIINFKLFVIVNLIPSLPNS